MLPSPEVKARRTAAYALNYFSREIAGLGSAERVHFDSEADDDWAVISLFEVKALKDGKLVALVELWGGQATISLVHPDMLWRGKAREFDYQDYGFHPPQYDGMGNMMAWTIGVGLPDEIPHLDRPVRKVPKQPRVRDIKVRRSL